MSERGSILERTLERAVAGEFGAALVASAELLRSDAHFMAHMRILRADVEMGASVTLQNRTLTSALSNEIVSSRLTFFQTMRVTITESRR